MYMGDVLLSRARTRLTGLVIALAPKSFPPFSCAAILILCWITSSLPWISGRHFVPYDSVDYFFPQSSFIVHSLLRGDLPLWNPFVYGGVPVFGDPQGMIFTPHTLTGLVIGVLTGRDLTLYTFDMTTIVLPAIGAVALLSYGQISTARSLMPLLGALVFLLGGVASSRLQHVGMTIAYAFLPVVLLALYAVSVRPNVGRTLLLAFAIFGDLANPNQVAFLSVFILTPFALVLVLRANKRATVVRQLCLAILIAAVCLAPQYAAIREVIAGSNRATTELGQSGPASMPLLTASSIVLPGLFGLLRPNQVLWAPTDVTEDYLYIGAVPVLLLLASMLGNRGDKTVLRLSFVLAVLSWLFAMGVHTPFYPVLFAHLPGLSGFRRPADAAFLLNFLFALLIIHSSLERPGFVVPSRWRTIGIALFCSVLGVTLGLLIAKADQAGQLGQLTYQNFRSAGLRYSIGAASLAALWSGNRWLQKLAPAALVAFTTADLTLAGRLGPILCPNYDSVASAQYYADPLASHRTVSTLDETIRFLQQCDSESPTTYREEALGGDFANGMPSAVGVASSSGYNPLRLERYAAVFGAQNLQNEPKRFTERAPSFDSIMYRELGLRYVLLHRYILDNADTFGDLGHRIVDIRKQFTAERDVELVAVPGEYEVWRLKNPYPKARLVSPDGAAEVSGTCMIAKQRNARIAISCDADRPAILVVNDTFADGWSACVNGKTIPIVPFHDVFRAVPVPAGKSFATFSYNPVPFLRVTGCA